MVRKPQGPKRPTKPSPMATTRKVPMNRSHAQQLRRAGSEPSFQTKVRRQQYWANRLAEQEMDTADTWAQEMAMLGHEELKSELKAVPFATATLQGPDPNQGPIEPGSAQVIAGVDTSGGFIPPPPG